MVVIVSRVLHKVQQHEEEEEDTEDIKQADNADNHELLLGMHIQELQRKGTSLLEVVNDKIVDIEYEAGNHEVVVVLTTHIKQVLAEEVVSIFMAGFLL